MSDLDKLEQLRSQLQRQIKEYATQGKMIGTDKDNEAQRKKLQRLRDRITEIDGKATALLSRAPSGGMEAADWDSLKQSIRELRQQFETVDREVRGKENAHRLPTGGGASDAAMGSSTGAAASRPTGGHTSVQMQHFRQVDDAELLTEEALQTEKLDGILSVERDMNELKSMYHEMHQHVVTQQDGLNTAETNIDKAQSHVEKGVVELKSANKLQKSSRKKMFILLAIIAVIAIIVIVVVVVMKKA